MTTPDYCTLDGDPTNGIAPYSPGVADMGGAAFVNDDVEPPVTEQNVMARDINQMQKLLVRACRMMPAAKFDITFSSGGRILNGFKSHNDLFVAGDITIDAYSHPVIGASMRLTWPLGKLRVAAIGPIVTPFSATTGGTAAIAQFVTSSTAGVCVNHSTGGYFRAIIELDGEGTFVVT
jgi:hypothetical protein